jgi:hypothetical protein
MVWSQRFLDFLKVGRFLVEFLGRFFRYHWFRCPQTAIRFFSHRFSLFFRDLLQAFSEKKKFYLEVRNLIFGYLDFLW